MSNLVEVLERIGRDARVRYASPARLEALLTSQGVSQEQLASHSQITCCMVHAPEGEEGREEDSAKAA